MNLLILKELADGETRVSMAPESVKKIASLGVTVTVESDAGKLSGFKDDQYTDAGAVISTDKNKALSETDGLVVLNLPDQDVIKSLKKGALLIGLLWGLQNKSIIEDCKKQGLTTISLDAVPRITRAQKMDALSSMSSISGYRSVLIGAERIPKYMPMLMTAAGTIPPAKVLVLGAGVAGLQAIATAKRLGAVVEAFDVRPAVKEQVESLGAKFIEVPLEDEGEGSGGYAKELSQKAQDKQREIIHEHVKKSDLVITTALIPGKKAPILITKSMVDDMNPGSVVVDLAAVQGGNCEYTENGKEIDINGVNIVGYPNLTTGMPQHASLLYGRNIFALIELIISDEGKLSIDLEDEILANSVLTHNGEWISPLMKG